MAAAQPQWKKEGRSSEAEWKELRELMMSADSEANIVDTASYRVLHLLDYADAHEYPQTGHAHKLVGSPTWQPRSTTTTQRQQQQKRFESAFNAYRVPLRQPAYLPGYCHNIGRDATDMCAVPLPGVPRPPRSGVVVGARGQALPRAVTVNFEGMLAGRVARSTASATRLSPPSKRT